MNKYLFNCQIIRIFKFTTPSLNWYYFLVYERIDGKLLEGRHILEIPTSNKKFKKIDEYIKLAKEKYDIDIRFMEE